MSALDDLNTAVNNLDAVQAELANVANELSVPANPSTGDQVLEAILPILTNAGYTVTPPAAPEAPSEPAA